MEGRRLKAVAPERDREELPVFSAVLFPVSEVVEEVDEVDEEGGSFGVGGELDVADADAGVVVEVAGAEELLVVSVALVPFQRIITKFPEAARL